MFDIKVWTTFLTSNAPDPSDRRLITLLYIVFWNTACAFAMFSTVMSILLMLYMNQTANDAEAKQFIEEYNKTTGYPEIFACYHNSMIPILTCS